MQEAEPVEAKAPSKAELEKRAKNMGFDDLAAAIKYLEALEENPPPGSAKNPIVDGPRVEQPPIHPEPRHRGR
jgi:hypothetical protein